ncbi:MAG: hypothetical protein ABI782_11330, partial [Anaerolineaceae bacterium]
MPVGVAPAVGEVDTVATLVPVGDDVGRGEADGDGRGVGVTEGVGVRVGSFVGLGVAVFVVSTVATLVDVGAGGATLSSPRCLRKMANAPPAAKARSTTPTTMAIAGPAPTARGCTCFRPESLAGGAFDGPLCRPFGATSGCGIRRGGGLIVGEGRANAAGTDRRAEANWAPVAKRSSGFSDRARATTASNSAEASRATVRIGGAAL